MHIYVCIIFVLKKIWGEIFAPVCPADLGIWKNWAKNIIFTSQIIIINTPL
jgi:hypothetical protein